MNVRRFIQSVIFAVIVMALTVTVMVGIMHSPILEALAPLPD